MMSTRNTILSLLKKEALTINEISARLGLARNAIVIPLQQLEAEGLLVSETRREKRAGKPAKQYVLRPGTEDSQSQAYRPFLTLLLDSLPDHLSVEETDRLMHAIGLKMAEQVGRSKVDTLEDRISAARQFVDELGAATEIEQQPGCTIVRSFNCPLGRAVRQQPCVCEAVRSFFSAVTGSKVHRACQHKDRLVCQFEIAT